MNEQNVMPLLDPANGSSALLGGVKPEIGLRQNQNCLPSETGLSLPVEETPGFQKQYYPPLLPRDDAYARLFGANVPVYVDPLHYVASVQSFSSGGYEVCIRMINAQKQAEQFCYGLLGGARVPRPEDERDENNILRSQIRAKKQVRLKVKEMAADRILTLTTRENENTIEDLLGKWQRWLKLVERASEGHFNYVAVPEPHPSNPKHFHMHVAIAVFLNVDILRRCWWQVCGGRGMGNIHIKRLTSNSPMQRVCRVASYISKYLTKETAVRFNKKRYWSSRVSLAEVKRYWLKGRNLSAAFAEACELLGIEVTLPFARGIFARDDADLCWFQVLPGGTQDPPF